MIGFQSNKSEHFGLHSIIARHVMVTFGNLNKRVRHYLDEKYVCRRVFVLKKNTPGGNGSMTRINYQVFIESNI